MILERMRDHQVASLFPENRVGGRISRKHVAHAPARNLSGKRRDAITPMSRAQPNFWAFRCRKSPCSPQPVAINFTIFFSC